MEGQKELMEKQKIIIDWVNKKQEIADNTTNHSIRHPMEKEISDVMESYYRIGVILDFMQRGQVFDLPNFLKEERVE